MSKTTSSVFCETNQIRGLPQENVFLQNLYRFPSDYNTAFLRTAISTAPVQICALASSQGDDTIGALALQEVMKILSAMVSEAQTRFVLDFEAFADRFLFDANTAVCRLSVSNQGTPVRVSITILFIEGDTLRIMSVGNTRAVLVRQGRVITLTEDQTVAHRYVQMGAIAPEAENLHPENNVLTQYIGKFTQDGPILPEKQINMKLFDNDEICLLGTGITQGLSDGVRDFVLMNGALPEAKANELIGRSVHSNIKGGLTVLILHIDSTYLMSAGNNPVQQESFLPAAGVAALYAADAASAASGSQAVAASDLRQPGSTSPAAQNESAYSTSEARRRARIMAVIRPLIVFLCCILAGYLGLMFLFSVGGMMKANPSPATDTNGSAAILRKVMYVKEQMVALYPSPSIEDEPVLYLNRGDSVTLIESSGSFSKVTTSNNESGYIITSMLSDSDPTIGESNPEMADPTPIPSKEQTAVTTSGPKTTKPTGSSAITPTPGITTTPSGTPTPGITPTPSVT